MKHVRILAINLLLCMAAGQVMAETKSLTTAIEAQLRAQGFTSIVVSTTWLGRTQIDAVSASQKREIVINPRTGEILRDYWHPVSGATVATEDILDSRTNGSGSQTSAKSDHSADGSGTGSEGSGSSGNTSSGGSSGNGSGDGSSGSGGSHESSSSGGSDSHESSSSGGSDSHDSSSSGGSDSHRGSND